MIHLILKHEIKAIKAINALSICLFALAIALYYRLLQSIYIRDTNEIWSTLAPLTASVSAILVTYVAERTSWATDRRQKEDSRLKSVTTIHYLITILIFFRQRMRYLKLITTDDQSRPLSVFTRTAWEAKSFYEKLYERENFILLPGSAANIIINLAGTMHGIATRAAILESYKNLESCPKSALDAPEVKIIESELMELEKILDELYALRESMA